MQDVIARVDELIEICDNIRSPSQYNQIEMEIDTLLIDLVGKDNDFYNNFTIIYKESRLNAVDKGKALVGVLRGLKTHIAIAKQEKKYQIFISSTYLDLIDYRQCVANEIAYKGHFVTGMEDFTACGEDLEVYIKNEIDKSDYYVLLIGQRFGSSISGNKNVSFTMMEYMYAKEKSLRIIPFIYNGAVPLKNNDLECNKDKLDRFIAEIQQTVPQYFKDENELLRKLGRALDNEFKNHPQKGWIRF